MITFYGEEYRYLLVEEYRYLLVETVNCLEKSTKTELIFNDWTTAK